LWSGGRYVEALSALESELGGVLIPSLPLQRDLAELLFLNGRVDEAIDAQKAVTSRHPLPSDLVRLARYQRYRGRWSDAETALIRASRQVRLLAEYDSLTEREWIAIGRIYELRGTDAKVVLAHYRDLQSQYNSLEAHIAVGELGLATYAYDLAAREYASALEIDANNQDALMGLLTCFHEFGDPREEEIATRLSKINPNHPRARTISARRHLDLGEFDAAEEELNRVLETNPVHLEALALKASVHFLRPNISQHGTTQHGATRTRVLDFNPRYAEFDRIVSEIVARHYRFEDAVAFLHAAIELDDQDPRIRLSLALNLLRLGKDEQARHHLETAFAADPYNVHAFNLLEVADEMDTFTTVGDGLWRLRLPSLEADVLSAEMLALLRKASSRYEPLYDVTLERPVIVQMFRDHDSFMVRSTGLPGNAGHLGICFGGLITMDSPRARPTGAVNWRQILWHEFVHVITLQKTRNRMPRWLSEGISVFEETRLDLAWGQRLDPDFREVLTAGYPTLADLESHITSGKAGGLICEPLKAVS
jgi:tetratricopeptide (TPR) repeat protein